MKRILAMVATVGATLSPPILAVGAEAPPQVYQAPAPASSNASTPAPPPSAPPKRSAAELEKLVSPIALYPDPLIATILPASVYPLEIVQAARFAQDTNNLPRLETQPWDQNVKAVARVPAVIQKMNEDLQWTVALGEAFLAQDKELLAAVQNLRGKAQQAGTLQTTPQQVVVVTNEVVEKTVEQQVVVVTNTIVQIQPSDPQVIYVPQYNPAVVYAPPPAYVYDPVAPLVTFGVGLAVGAAIANNCDWHGGGVYVGHHGAVVWGGGGHHGDVNINANINHNTTYNRNVNVNNARATPAATPAGQQKWQPDQSRLRTGGASASAGTQEARGWSAGAAQPATGAATARPAASTLAANSAPSARPAAAAAPSRPAPSPNASPPRTSTAGSRSASSAGSAFSGVNSGASARDFSSRGTASRSSGMSASRGSFGGGGRGGGRR